MSPVHNARRLDTVWQVARSAQPVLEAALIQIQTKLP